MHTIKQVKSIIRKQLSYSIFLTFSQKGLFNNQMFSYFIKLIYEFYPQFLNNYCEILVPYCFCLIWKLQTGSYACDNNIHKTDRKYISILYNFVWLGGCNMHVLSGGKLASIFVYITLNYYST